LSHIEPQPTEVTVLLTRLSDGDATAMSSLFDVLYLELRRIAVAAMRAERREHTLQPTALVHEAFVRLADMSAPLENRRHFFGVAAMAMRRILVEHARARGADKRGANAPHVSMEGVDVPAIQAEAIDIESLDMALTRLATLDARQAQIVELRYFAGLSVEQTAELIGISPRTVKRDWQMSRAWLRREVSQPS
jgi:RNA polymerase sigma factor (TIGR02999 family)